MNLCSTQRSGCVLIKCGSRPVLLAQPMTSQYVQEIEMEMPMKTSLKFVLLAIGLSNVMMLPAPAQQVKSRNQGCDNKTTSRDKTLSPDNRCLSAAPEKYRHQQYKYQQFMKATPPSQLRLGPNGSVTKKVSGTELFMAVAAGGQATEVRRRPVEAAADRPRQDNASSYSTV